MRHESGGPLTSTTRTETRPPLDDRTRAQRRQVNGVKMSFGRVKIRLWTGRDDDAPPVRDERRHPSPRLQVASLASVRSWLCIFLV